MNSEELELSLRTEFESYLKEVIAEMRQGVNEFQLKINADFEKHREELDKSLSQLNEKFSGEKELETSFTETVVEHLKLARDEGASVTAAAIAEAEKLDEEAGPDFSDLRDAIADISSKDSQSEILKALVNHSSAFTPRGAFFIVKNEHLVGWRVFGRESHDDPNVVREVFFPVSTNTVLGAAVDQLTTVMSDVEDSQDDVMYRNKLGFENPNEMFAIPLIARGRGVAVLYADSGSDNGRVNISAIETLMKVAGLTVEVLASAPHVAKKKEADETPEEVSESAEGSFETAGAPAVDHADEQPVEEIETDVVYEEAAESEVEEPEFAPIASPVGDFAGSEETVEVGSEDYAAVGDEVEAEFEPISEDTPYESSEYVSETAETAESVDEPVVGYEAPSWDQSKEVAENDSLEEDTPSDSYREIDSSDAFAPDVSFTGGYDTTADTKSSFESFDAPAEEPVADEVETDNVPYQFESTTDEMNAAEDVDSGTYSFDASEPYSVDEEVKGPVDVVETADSYSFEQTMETPVEVPVEDTVADYAEEETVAEYKEEEVVADYAAEEPVADFTEERVISDELPEQFRNQPAEAPAAEQTFDAPVVAEVESTEPAPPVRSRFADRNLDLPIEVEENERRLHNDARRFARLLVSEIKLYNEQKVKEGRESCDLYERLREAIDRSREMYDKRVQPPVAAKFDYFNYELVNALAEGDEGRLGGSYPGPTI